MSETAYTEIVETVTGTSMAELRAARDRADADIIELRLDGVADLDVAGALADRSARVIVTCRPTWEGGQFDGSEEDRLRILSEAARLGAEYVDLEWRADRRGFVGGPGTQVVLSNHESNAVPADLAERVRAMRAERPAVVKVVVRASRLRDCLTLRDAFAGGAGRQVAIAMGPSGLLTRLCPWLFGSAWTYGGTAAAEDIDPQALRHMFRVHLGSQATAIYALFGAPLGHSASPAMHNRAFAVRGLDAIYVTLESQDPDDALAVAEAFGVRGASVTAPLKTALYERVANTDEMCRRVGALNTLKRDGGWQGRNYDVDGFLSPIRARALDLRGKRAVVLGAGGAARTAVWALGKEGAQVEIVARRPERGAALAAERGVVAAPWPPRPGWDLLVNATPVGTWPHLEASPLDSADVAGGLVYDLIYNPRETLLLQRARAAGLGTIDGLEMLVGQAALQFRWWTGQDAPVHEMAAAAETMIANATRHRP